MKIVSFIAEKWEYESSESEELMDREKKEKIGKKIIKYLMWDFSG